VGVANIAAGRRVTPDTLFMLASVSKTVVATAVSKRPRTACSTSTPT
jgi:CubicO group peptidase (beta-lactamase class C family)